ncbi:MAG: hypothetical protein ACK5VW_01350 [Holosporales bacterium]
MRNSLGRRARAALGMTAFKVPPDTMTGVAVLRAVRWCVARFVIARRPWAAVAIHGGLRPSLLYLALKKSTDPRLRWDNSGLEIKRVDLVCPDSKEKTAWITADLFTICKVQAQAVSLCKPIFNNTMVRLKDE